MSKVLLIYSSGDSSLYNSPNGAKQSLIELKEYLDKYYTVKLLIYSDSNSLESKKSLILKEYCKFIPDVIITFQSVINKLIPLIENAKFIKCPIILGIRVDTRSNLFNIDKLYSVYKYFYKVQLFFKEYSLDSSKEVYIPNAFDIPKKLDYTVYNNKILYSGRIDKEMKQTNYLTDIISTEYEYNFIGNDVDNLLKNKCCNYYGYIIENINDFYKSNSVNIITSLYDGFCRSCIEGMTYGLPSIGFADCFISRKHIKNGFNGLLAEERSSECLKHTIDLFFNEYNTVEIKKNAYMYSLQYSKDKIYPLWKKLIDDTIKDCI